MSKTQLRESLSSYIHLLNGEDDPIIFLPFSLYRKLSESFANDWRVGSAWQVLTLHTINSVLHAVKSNLMNFLLEVADELGEGDKINTIKQNDIIDLLYEKNLGYIKTMNVISGSNNIQNNISGSSNKTQIVIGDNNNQQASIDDIEKVREIINDLNHELNDKLLDPHVLEDIRIQINCVESQLKRSKPSKSIFKSSLGIIKELLIGAGSNIVSDMVMANLSGFIS